MTEWTAEEVAEQRDRLMDRIRAFGASYTEMTRRFATWLGLHSRDAAALAEILYAEDLGKPLSPARLGERISLTSGATTALLNRLEKAEYIVRSREHADRRIVTLRSSPGVRAPAEKFFRAYSDRLSAEFSTYEPDQLRDIERFIIHMGSVMESLLANEYKEVR
jgi:MarR family transcriptional regulator, organic hydroperoxide resistance regulator